MKLIKNFKKFFDNRKIDAICKEYRIENYTINSDGSIDVDDNVWIINQGITKLPLKFGRVRGSFYCYDNQLTSLEGTPKEVGGHFYCYNNQLTSLEGAPKEVGGDFDCSHNQLTTLEGCPKEIGGDFICSRNELTTLEGGPRVVNGKFDCSSNQLTSLRGGPEWVKWEYNACHNQITSFEGFPDKHTDDCFFYGNPVNKILYEFPEELWVKAIPLIIDYDVIWNGKVVPERLEMIKEKLGLS